jgi:predicted transcriptional regulator
MQNFLEMPLSKTTQKFLGLNEFSSNQEIIKSVISKYPGLRFHEIKKETKLANGTLQHHLGQMTKSNTLKSKYIDTIPRYYAYDLEDANQLILLRLRQRTTSRIIKSLLKNECQTFAQLVKFSKKSPGTVSIYKNMLLKDNIIVGDTNSCDCTKSVANTSIKYRLVEHEKVHMLVEEYGKSSLRQSVDNLADIFLALK